MRRATAAVSLILIAGGGALSTGCSDSISGPTTIEGEYHLASENGEPLPSDPFGPSGCCLTRSGQLSLHDDTYELVMSFRNKQNGIEFTNSETGTFVVAGNDLQLSRTGGGGANLPFLIGAGRISPTLQTITLHYGDEGPGSNQVVGVFRRS